VDAYGKYAQENNLELEGTVGENNAAAIRDYFLDLYKEDINDRTLPLAVERLRKAGRLVFRSAAKAKFDQAIQALRMNSTKFSLRGCVVKDWSQQAMKVMRMPKTLFRR
jgi:hypothetical protein